LEGYLTELRALRQKIFACGAMRPLLAIVPGNLFRTLLGIYTHQGSSPKFLCLLLIFQDFAGWWLDPSRTWRKLFLQKSEEEKCLQKIRGPYFVRTSGLDIYTHPTAAPIFFACYGFFSGGLAWHQGAPLFCGPGLGQKKLKSFSRRLRVTSKIGSPYFVWTSGLNIYMQWISPRSKHPPWGQEFQHRPPLLHSWGRNSAALFLGAPEHH
jgi:hypothetical protein